MRVLPQANDVAVHFVLARLLADDGHSELVGRGVAREKEIAGAPAATSSQSARASVKRADASHIPSQSNSRVTARRDGRIRYSSDAR